MRRVNSGQSNQWRWIAAGGVLLVGGACAAQMIQTPARAEGPDTRQLRALAQRLAEAPVPASVVPERAWKPVRRDDSFSRPNADRSPAVSPQAPAPTPAASPAASPAPVPEPAPAPAPEDPVKNIALVGVTRYGNDEQAWLMELDSRGREMVGPGESAFGFTVKEVQDDRVLLTRGSDHFMVRLGEKRVPVAAEAAPAVPAEGFRGQGGGSSREEVRQQVAQNGGSAGGGGGWNGGGRSWGGGGSGGGASSNNDGRRNSGGGSGPSGGGGGGFNPAMAQILLSGGGRRRSGFGANASGPTSNAQTARRRGDQVVGDSEPFEIPDPISNPQTSRRLGSTSGPAFGNVRPGGNRR